MHTNQIALMDLLFSHLVVCLPGDPANLIFCKHILSFYIDVNLPIFMNETIWRKNLERHTFLEWMKQFYQTFTMKEEACEKFREKLSTFSFTN